MVKLEMTFNSWKEMQDFFSDVGSIRMVPGTCTVTSPFNPIVFPYSGPALQLTEPTGIEPKKRGRKPKAEAPPPPAEPTIPAAAEPMAPVTGPAVSDTQRDEIRAALKTFMSKHGLAAAEALLKKYNAAKVMDLKAEHFDAFKKDIQG